MAEYRLTLTIQMTRAEQATFRSEHAMAGDDSLRAQLAQTLATELDGLGTTTGWWHQADAR